MAQQNQFLATTQIYRMDPGGSSFEYQLRTNLNSIVLALNSKESGYYSQEEILSGKLFYPDYAIINSATGVGADYRPEYRKVIDTGTLPNTGTTTTAHGITFLPVAGNTTFIATRIYGAATDPVNRIMLPLAYASPTLNQNISVYVDQTNVYITTGINRAAFTVSHIVIEYIKL